jgi:hypothetical protein
MEDTLFSWDEERGRLMLTFLGRSEVEYRDLLIELEEQLGRDYVKNNTLVECLNRLKLNEYSKGLSELARTYEGK